MSISLESFYDEVLIYAPGVPSVVMKKEILKSAQRFCRQAFCVLRTYTVTVPALGDTVSLSDLAAADGLGVVKPVEVSIDGRLLDSVTLDRLRSNNRYYQSTPAAEPRVYYMETEGTLKVYPSTDRDVEITFRLACYPLESSTALPDELGGLYQEGVVGGAIERICAIPQQPYTNAEYAALGRSWFQKYLSDARINFNNSFGRDMAVNQRPFVRGRRRF